MSQSDKKPKLLIDIENLDLQKMVEATIYSMLDERVKEDLVKKCMQFLGSSTGTYNSKTVLAEEFERAIRDTARKIASEFIEKDEKFIAETKRIVETALTRWVETDKQTIINNVTDYITKHLFNREGY